MSAVSHDQTLLRRMSIVQRCAALAAIVWGAALVALPVAYQLASLAGLQAAAVAAVVCWICSTVALLLTARGRGQNAALKGLLYSMFFQMGVPLLVGISLSKGGGDLARGGVFAWIVVFHLITLASKTVLVLPLLSSGKSSISQGA